MLLSKTKYLLVGGLAVLLAACGGSELDKKSAQDLYQQAVQHLYAKDAQYNFKADMKVKINIENPFFSDAKIKLSGAVNNSVQRYELVPELETEIFNFKLPALIDVEKQELLLDPSNVLEVLSLFALEKNTELQQYKNKFVRFSIDNFEVDESDMTEALTVFSEVVDIGYGALSELTQSVPESSIQKADLDDKAKDLGAKVVLHVKLDQQQSKELQQHMHTYMYDKIKVSSKLPEDFKEGAMEALLNTDGDTGYESSESVIYLNEKGQIIHQSDVLTFEVEGDQINIVTAVNYSNYGNAIFSINPSKDQILDFTEKDRSMLQAQ